jgi:hypothetical protein
MAKEPDDVDNVGSYPALLTKWGPDTFPRSINGMAEYEPINPRGSCLE